MSGISQAEHARRAARHLEALGDDRALREEAGDEEEAMQAFRRLEDVYLDVDAALAAIIEVSDS